jgi:hypothetical protein
VYGAALWNEQDAWTGLLDPEPRELDRHCGDIVANQNALLLGCQTQNIRVIQAIKWRLLSGSKIDRWLASPNTHDNGALKVVVGKVTDLHVNAWYAPDEHS